MYAAGAGPECKKVCTTCPRLALAGMWYNCSRGCLLYVAKWPVQQAAAKSLCRFVGCCFCREEVDALANAVKEHGMALVVFAEW